MSYTEDADFTAEDRGGFKHPDTVGEYSYTELEDKVLAAIDDDNGEGDGRGFRTLMRIKMHAGLEKAFDLSPVIEGMELDKKIRREDNGNITAFFRHSQKPTRFWINGDGTIGAEFDENFVSDRTLPKQEYYGRPAVDAKVIDPEELEKAAAKFASPAEIARSFGISTTTLYNNLNGSNSIKAAYDRGRHRFAARNNPEPPAEATSNQKSEENMETSTAAARPDNRESPSYSKERAKKELTPAMVLKASKTQPTLIEVAKACGLGQAAFSKYLKRDPELRKAYDDGREIYYANNPKRAAIAKRGKPTPRPAVDQVMKYAPQDVERHAAELGSKRRVAIALGYRDASGFRERLKQHPEMAAAYDRGLQRFAAEDKNPEVVANTGLRDQDIDVNPHTAEPAAQISHISDQEEPDETATERTAESAKRTENANAKPSVHHRFITFDRGSQVLVGFEGNYFDLTSEERELLTQLTEIFDAYENRGPFHAVHFEMTVNTRKLEEALRAAEARKEKAPSIRERVTAVFKKKEPVGK